MSRIFSPPLAGFRRFAVCGAILLSAFCVSPVALAAPPKIANVSPRGLRIGGTTTLVIAGTGLGPQTRLVLSVPIAKQTIKPGGTDTRVEIEVALDRAAQPGILPLRVATAAGISQPVAVGVDAAPQVLANSIAAKPGTLVAPVSLPIAIHGAVSGGEIFRARFVGEKGQRVLADVESRRLGAVLNPVVRLLDPRGTQIAYSGGIASIAGDARCEAILPTAGTYTVEVFDRLYRAAAPNYFRLKLGDLHYADVPFPLGARQGESAKIGFAVSSLPENFSLAQASVPLASSFAIGSPPDKNLTGAMPRVVASPHPELVEPDSSADAKMPMPLGKAPVAVSGRFGKSGEQDKYSIEVAPNGKYRVELFAERVGSPVDATLDVENLGTSDDRAGTKDPALEVTAGKNQKHLVVSVRDLLERGGREFVYRLVVAPAGVPDFKLTADTGTINLSSGGTAVFKINVARKNFDGPIDLKPVNPPKGIQISGLKIGAGAIAGLVVVSSDPDDAATGSKPIEPGVLRFIGVSADPKHNIAREVQVPETPLTQLLPELAGEIVIAVAGPAPIEIAWDSLPAGAKLPLGGKLAAKARLVRHSDASGPVRISLVTDQVVPQKEMPDPKDSKKKIKIDEVDKAVRLGSKVELTGPATDAALELLVPADLPAGLFARGLNVGLKAELLSADKKRVLATAYSELRPLAVVRLLSIELTGPATVQMKADGKTPPKFIGKILRDASLPAGPVTITLGALPAGMEAPAVTIAAGKTDFEFPVVLPGAKSGELKDLQLIAHTGDQPAPEETSILSAGVKVGVKISP